jgi:hypothetical protein
MYICSLCFLPKDPKKNTRNKTSLHHNLSNTYKVISSHLIKSSTKIRQPSTTIERGLFTKHVLIWYLKQKYKLELKNNHQDNNKIGFYYTFACTHGGRC